MRFAEAHAISQSWNKETQSQTLPSLTAYAWTSGQNELRDMRLMTSKL